MWCNIYWICAWYRELVFLIQLWAIRLSVFALFIGCHKMIDCCVSSDDQCFPSCRNTALLLHTLLDTVYPKNIYLSSRIFACISYSQYYWSHYISFLAHFAVLAAIATRKYLLDIFIYISVSFLLEIAFCFINYVMSYRQVHCPLIAFKKILIKHLVPNNLFLKVRR